MIEKAISIDLEAIGNTPLAPIVQIGACVFDIEGVVTDEFEVTVDPNSLTKYRDDFKMDYSTVTWWLNQSDEAQQSVFGYKLSTHAHLRAMELFEIWVKDVQNKYDENIKAWSHATFDPPILTRNIKVAGLRPPIHFANFVDIRTLEMLTGGKIKINRTGIHHNALSDAITQANYISKMLREIL